VNLETIVEDLEAKIEFELRGRSDGAGKTFATITLLDRYSTQLSPQLIAQVLSIGADHVALIDGDHCEKGQSHSEKALCLRYLPAHAIAAISAHTIDSGAMSASQVSLAHELRSHVGRRISIVFLGNHKSRQNCDFISQSGEWIKTSAGLYSIASVQTILVHDVLG
jgi:predicted house-cleaning NTP pyrophosphatase (Maf/HAM1 superfamily)